ncbi:uncharacterized protein LOC103517009 [Diaphorina citri]|uniref:Uncharacterized protein LOC103517009 n=1 Tax=Diaphorina citri TaxID=121845 RepID=A0A3Q0JDG8_DIACI|nr:uncharacterized protein LOC103517009 [Diaphorina citri]
MSCVGIDPLGNHPRILHPIIIRNEICCRDSVCQRKCYLRILPQALPALVVYITIIIIDITAESHPLVQEAARVRVRPILGAPIKYLVAAPHPSLNLKYYP